MLDPKQILKDLENQSSFGPAVSFTGTNRLAEPLIGEVIKTIKD